MLTLTSAEWWKAATIRAARTALVVAVPYVPASYFGSVPYLAMASAAGLGFILSLFTSLAGLSEVTGKILPWWYAILSRVVKTTAQAGIAYVGTAVLIQDVDWNLLLQASLTAGFGSLLLAFLSQLPEAELPVAVTNLNTIVINEGGKHEESDPVVATISVTVPTENLEQPVTDATV